MIYCISEFGSEGHLDAKIELDGSDVLLQSRGGATGGRAARNTDYEKALQTIIERLYADEHTIDAVFLDSRVARKKPEEKRLLANAAELNGMSDEAVVALVRRRASRWGQAPGTRGGNSTKALRIRVRNLDQSGLRSALVLMKWETARTRRRGLRPLAAEEQRKVSIHNVENAVARLLTGEDAPNFSGSKDYDVVAKDGTLLAPKKVFGLALEEALGIETFPEHFKAGWKQPCFQIIQAAGFEIVEKGFVGPNPDELHEELSDIPLDEADRSAQEGDVRLVMHFRRERARGLSERKKAAFIREHGRLYCERCNMDPVAVYGINGDACIEVHHAHVQVKDMREGHQTNLEELQCLCANCHRITHRELASQS
ncbi:5-methylcytosine-specific restriction protein A [Rhodobacter aestuarii]|uniref:5-methylcytosine-specific restriction enzyme A n=1 Tax=Rhodobacter aestuarii TaxID=453582 RepID=A0A1N7PH71_9RHOB|nr:hypothetical protein [Rhodobacter aestuarii]PTV94420.1 5-methylcytosine-specific restriction protein A [Rhodobacter aestuarii]SIT09886.1 5-methylcytosine-specific restriction enzyme A [Rhodobacter aestuarii]